MTVLLQQFFFPKDRTRQLELMKCFNINCSNIYIDKIIHLNETTYKIGNKKLSQVITKKRLIFNDAIKYANENHVGETIIIANADIWFDDTLKNIDLLNLDSNTLVCNLRWEKNNKLFTKNGEPRNDSQDFWIFKSPLNIIFPYKIELGKPGCDKAIIQLCFEQNINAINIPYLIKGHHLQSKINTYKESIPVPCRNIIPSKTMIYIHDHYSQKDKNDILSKFEKDTYVLVGRDDKPHCVFIPKDVLKIEKLLEKEDEFVNADKENTDENTKVKITVNSEKLGEEKEDDKINIDDINLDTTNDELCIDKIMKSLEKEKSECNGENTAKHLDDLIDKIIMDYMRDPNSVLEK